MSLFANPFDPATYRWVAPTVAKAADTVAHVAVDVSPVGILYATGGAINAATGGKTTTFDAYAALTKGAAKGTTYSPVTQAASGYQGVTPGGGTWSFPVANKATVTVAAQTVKVAASVVHDVAGAASEGLLGVSLTTLLLGAAGIAGLGVATYAATR